MLSYRHRGGTTPDWRARLRKKEEFFSMRGEREDRGTRPELQVVHAHGGYRAEKGDGERWGERGWACILVQPDKSRLGQQIAGSVDLLCSVLT